MDVSEKIFLTKLKKKFVKNQKEIYSIYYPGFDFLSEKEEEEKILLGFLIYDHRLITACNLLNVNINKFPISFFIISNDAILSDENFLKMMGMRIDNMFLSNPINSKEEEVSSRIKKIEKMFS